jgi:uncharacterized protein
MFGAAQTKGTPNRESSSRRYFDVEARISSGGDFKNKDLHRIRFDRGGNAHYYTRPMAAGLLDRVDCERLADEAAAIERVYELNELPRLHDLLADNRGDVRASFTFKGVGAGRAGATVRVQGEPNLVCQRCMQSLPVAIAGESEIEFVEAGAADSEDATPLESQREIYVMDRGRVSLRELAEEELLLAIPAIASCASPETCGNAPSLDGERSRPLAALRDLLKKT